MTDENTHKHMRLDEILTQEQIKQVTELWNKHRNFMDRVAKLHKFCEGIAPQLEAKGIVPAYLAYLLEYLFMKYGGMVNE